MRFERLHLTAFGPFTDEVIDLSGGKPGGLHVIYGANEAGKSTSLRAVTALLFGFPHRTPDAHLHPQNRLSVGAEVSEGSERFRLVRLKRRKDDLVDQKGDPVAQDPLPSLLGHLDERSFTSRFGLDQVELERGAEALLGGSEQGLFAAGTAGARARAVLDELEKSTTELYLPRGKVPRLNRALLEYEQVSREARRAERTPEKWLEQKRAHEDAVARVGELKKRRAETRAELRRLNRIRSVLKDLQDWNEIQARRAQLGDPPRLPEDAKETRIAAERQVQEATAEARRIEAEILAFEQESNALPPDSPLVEVDDEQLGLSTRVGTALSARKDLPKRQASLIEQVRHIRGLLSELGQSPAEGEELATARALMIGSRTSATVRRLASERGALVQSLAGTTLEVDKLVGEQARLSRELGASSDSTDIAALEAALEDARVQQVLLSRLGDLDLELCELRAEQARLRAELGDPRDYRTALSDVPTKAGARNLVDEARRSNDELAKLDAERQSATDQLGQITERIAVEERGDLPSGEKLAHARAQRDEAISEIERCADGARPVPPATVRHLRKWTRATDDVADRLRGEADRVAEIAALAQKRSEVERRLARVQEERAAISARIEEQGKEFQRTLVALGVSRRATPLEAEDVFEMVRKWAAVEQRLEGVERLRAETAARLASASARLERVLDLEPGKVDFAGLVTVASRRVREAVAAQSRRKEREEALARLEVAKSRAQQQRGEAEFALAAWQEKWAEAMQQLGLAPESSPIFAEETLATFERIARIIDVADNLEGRIVGMVRDTESLARDVRDVLRRHLPHLLDLDPVDAAVELQEAIRAARRVGDERARFRRLLAERRAALSSALSRKAFAEAGLGKLVEVSGVSSVDDLPAAEERLREIRSLEARREALEKSIRDASEGASLEHLQEEARVWRSRAQLIERIDDLDAAATNLDEELRSAERDEAGTRLGLETYRSQDVVEARQRASAKAAEAGELLRRYLVLATAQAMLSSQVENYAERFAGPILRRAGELFERLTLGRYTALRVGLGEKTLRCVREGAEVEVSQLSRGTRAQLYFALRLSSLENYFERQPAVPLVFDDLFVDFDDNRTTAAFEILAEMSRKVQILYFTHLARDVEAAHDGAARGQLFEHRLG